MIRWVTERIHCYVYNILIICYCLGSHKLLFLQENIIDKVIALLNQASDPNIIIKAIGCLRLLATETGKDDRLIILCYLSLSLSLSLPPPSLSEVCKHLALVNPVIKRICNACELSGFPHIIH